MSSADAYELVMGRLKPLVSFNDTTSLCIECDTNVLFIVKTLPVKMAEVYQPLVGMDNTAIAPIRYVFSLPDRTVVVHDYLSGQTLSDILERDVCLTPEKALRYAVQIADGLSALHRIGLVHRDINPNNIIITSDGNARIIDFGIMRSFTEIKSKDTVILGTPGYAAPEQFGFTQSDSKTDIYALGVLLNVMLTGNFPSEAKPNGQLLKIVSKSTAMDAKKRYRSMSDMRNELFSCYSGLRNVRPLDLTEKNPTGRAGRWLSEIPGIRSSHPIVVALSVILYLFAGLFIFSVYQIGSGGAAFFINTMIVLFTVVIPYVCLSNFFHIWDKLPFTAGSSRSVQRKTYYTLSALSIFVGLLWISVSGSRL